MFLNRMTNSHTKTFAYDSGVSSNKDVSSFDAKSKEKLISNVCTNNQQISIIKIYIPKC